MLHLWKLTPSLVQVQFIFYYFLWVQLCNKSSNVYLIFFSYVLAANQGDVKLLSVYN